MAAIDKTMGEFGISSFVEGFLFPGLTVGYLMALNAVDLDVRILVGSWIGAAAVHVMRSGIVREEEYLSGFGTALAIGLAIAGTKEATMFVPAVMVGLGAMYLALRAGNQTDIQTH